MATVNNGLTPATVPAEYEAHPLIQGRLFFSLPIRLLDEIERYAPKSLDPELLQLERCVGEINQDHSSSVGFWSNVPISYRFLEHLPNTADVFGSRPPNWKTDAFWKDLGWYTEAALREGIDAIEWSYSVCAAYCGWLVTNRQFVDEHDAFFEKFKVPIAAIGGLPPVDGIATDASTNLGDCATAYLELCGRWQIRGLAGPYLPEPLQPFLPLLSSHINLLPLLARTGGMFFYFPHTHPLPDRNRLRQLIEHALARATLPPHLKEWADLIDASHPGKRSLERYERIFCLQHWYRLIHHRHASFARRNAERLQKALAVFVMGDDPGDKHFESVRKDVGDIAHSLGDSAWRHKPSALQHF